MNKLPKLEDFPPDEDAEKWLKENADIAKQMAFDRCYAIGKEPLEVTEDDV